MNGPTSSLSPSPSPPSRTTTAYVPPHRRHDGSGSGVGSRDGGSGSGSSNSRWTTSVSSQTGYRWSMAVPPWKHDDHHRHGGDAIEKRRQSQQSQQSHHRRRSAVTTTITTTTTTTTTTTNTTVLLQAFCRIYCINLRRRPDRWNTFCQRLLSSLQVDDDNNSHNNDDDSSRRRRQLFRDQVQRFDAVDGAVVLSAAGSAAAAAAASTTDEKETTKDGNNGDNIHHLLSSCCLMEWDATQNAKWDRHIQPPLMNKRLTPGEVGCAMSHVALWKKALEELLQNEQKEGRKEDSDDGDSDDGKRQQQQPKAMLILEDDAVLYRGRKSANRNDQRRGTRHHDHGRPSRSGYSNSNRHHQQHQHQQQHDGDEHDDEHDDDGFAAAFAKVWTAASRADENLLATPPNYAGGPWDILYFGFSHRGERTVVYRSNTDPQQQQHDGHVGPDSCLFRPTYGFHTHAYAITHEAAARLLDKLPVVGPVDVWLADHDWFGLNVLVGCIENNNKCNNNRATTNLISQRRHDTASDIAQSGRTNENETIL